MMGKLGGKNDGDGDGVRGPEQRLAVNALSSWCRNRQHSASWGEEDQYWCWKEDEDGVQSDSGDGVGDGRWEMRGFVV